MSRRGFLFSMDILFAVMLTLIVLSGTMLFLSRQSSPPFGVQDLQHTSLGALVALDAGGTLRNFAQPGAAAQIQQFLDNATAKTLCMNLTIRTASGQLQASYAKQGCARAQTIITARRPLETGNGTSIATLESWYT